MTETVVLVHGVWMTGLELALLGRQLRKCGYRTVLFHYHSLLKPLADSAARLAEFVHKQQATTVHLVAHSLGGLVVLQALQDHPALISGRIVLIGSPVNGSLVARRVYRYRPLRWMVGKCAQGGLLCGGPRWRGGRSLGMISGTRPIGVGFLVGGFDGPNDGTVAVSETVLENASDSTSFNRSHFGLVVSKPVAAAVCNFLEQGRFH